MVIFHSYVSLPEGYHIWTPGRDDALRTIHSSSEIAAMGAWRPMDFSNGKGGWMAHHGSMVLLYMVCHGSHQYTPFMLAYIYIYIYIPYMDPMGGGFPWRMSRISPAQIRIFLGIWRYDGKCCHHDEREIPESSRSGNNSRGDCEHRWLFGGQGMWIPLIIYHCTIYIYMIWYAYTLNINI